MRLVVYDGPARAPSVVFNEKVMAGLGKGTGADGRLDPAARERALAALARFRLLTARMDVARTRVVATAAVRDAADGADFLAEVRALGFDPEMLSGEQEGWMAAEGVLSAIPDADGLAGDLGGGSLELADISGGRPRASLSMPLGVLRLPALLEKGVKALDARIEAGLSGGPLGAAGKGRPLYLVGGSWRGLARLDMAMTGHPLPVLHCYRMAPDRPEALIPLLDGLDKASAKAVPSLSSARVPTLPHANLLLARLCRRLRPSALVVSAYGIREGLLHDALDPETRARDPLLEAAREAGRGLGRFPPHGDLLDRWIAPLFDDRPADARLRLAACLLADIAWRAHPDFRAERGIEMALHGNWVGIDAPGRVMLAQALASNFGGGEALEGTGIAGLCAPDALARASLWGLAMRLGQRLSGGVAAGLGTSRLERRGGRLLLHLAAGDEALYGEAVARRFRALAEALGLEPETAVSRR